MDPLTALLLVLLIATTGTLTVLLARMAWVNHQRRARLDEYERARARNLARDIRRRVDRLNREYGDG